MNKILSAVLSAALLAGAPCGYAQNSPSSTKIGAKVQSAQRQAELNKKALQSLPEKAKTTVRFRIMETWEQDGRATFSNNHCSALFLDYNTANGLGNVTVAMKGSCVNKVIKESFAFAEPSHKGWMEFGVYMTKFGYDPRIHDDIEDFMYLTELNAQNKTYPKLKQVTTEAGSLYIFQMPVPSSSAQMQKEFRQLFPAKANFITLEKAARALAAMK